jgi:hypothetical protein
LAIITNASYQNYYTCSFNLSFNSNLTIYQSQVRCHVNENEFNTTLNPSALSGSFGDYNANLRIDLAKESYLWACDSKLGPEHTMKSMYIYNTLLTIDNSIKPAKPTTINIRLKEHLNMLQTIEEDLGNNTEIIWDSDSINNSDQIGSAVSVIESALKLHASLIRICIRRRTLYKYPALF